LKNVFLLDKLNKEQGRTILMVIHDLNHAARFSHYMIALKKGRVIKEGTAEEVSSYGVSPRNGSAFFFIIPLRFHAGLNRRLSSRLGGVFSMGTRVSYPVEVKQKAVEMRFV
jgi:energy-coupling factor transporter ATP-binding protein EcfA2